MSISFEAHQKLIKDVLGENIDKPYNQEDYEKIYLEIGGMFDEFVTRCRKELLIEFDDNMQFEALRAFSIAAATRMSQLLKIMRDHYENLQPD